MTAAPRGRTAPLLEDGALAVEIGPAVAERVAHWLPRLDARGGAASARRCAARIRVVEAAGPPAPAPSAPPTLRLGGAAAWIGHDGGRAVLGRPDRAEDGWIDLAAGRAELSVPATPAADSPVDVYSLLTIASAVLLGRLGRALLHAAAVVAPGGAAWLLVGDAYAGKTTTLVNLIRAGWDWLSDDHVVLSRPDGAPPAGGAASVRVEGWPRPFHLDERWPDAEPGGERLTVDPDRLGPGLLRTAAPLRGSLFPRVEPDEPTRGEPITPGDALARLVRQSPWLLADGEVASPVLELLRAAAARPARALRLGRDCYADAAPVLRALDPSAGL